MGCEEWLDDTQIKVFEVVKESFGGAKLASILPEGTRTIIIWDKNSRGVKVVLSCTETIAIHNVDVLLKPSKTGPSKSEIYEGVAAVFHKQM